MAPAAKIAMTKDQLMVLVVATAFSDGLDVIDGPSRRQTMNGLAGVGPPRPGASSGGTGADGANDGLLLDDYATLNMPLMCHSRRRGKERLAGTILQRKFGLTR